MCWTVDVCFQIRPQEMSEGCFWVLADEDQYAKPELLSRVALTFCSQRTGKTLLTCLYTYLFNVHLPDCWLLADVFTYFSIFLFFPNALYFRLPLIPASAWMCAFGFNFPCVVREKNGRVSQSSWSGKTRKNNVKAFLFLCCAYVRACIHLCLWVIDGVFSLRRNYMTKIQTNVFLYQPSRLLLANLLFYHFQLMASEICLTEIISYFFNCVQFPLLS